MQTIKRFRKVRLVVLILLIVLLVVALGMMTYFTKNKEIVQISATEQKAMEYVTSSDQLWEYYINDDDSTATITKYKGDQTDVTIPTQVDSHNVTKLDKSFLWNIGSGSITNLTIPSSITDVTATASGLGITTGSKVQKIKVDESNTNYSSDDKGILFDKEKTKIIRCPEKTTLTEYNIPGTVSIIEEYSFVNCKTLTNITIPTSVIEINNYSLKGTGLTELNIPESVIRFDDNNGHYLNLDDCENLININVDPNNKIFSSINGVLCNKDKTIIYQYPEARTDTTYEIPESVIEIDQFSFAMCKLVSIKIPEGVTKISSQAFFYCEKLQFVEIPKSVKEIKYAAFNGCNNLEKVICKTNDAVIGNSVFSGCNKLKIQCYKNSTAYEYAVKNSINYELVEPVLSSISVKENPTKTTYIQNEKDLKLDGGILKLTYDDESTQDISMTTEGVTTSGFDSSKVGQNTITISYGGKSTTFQVTIVAEPAKTLSSISVKQKPTKTTYILNEEKLKLDGGILTLKYDNNTTEELQMTAQGVETTGFSNSTLGPKTITISYGGKSTTFEVNIVSKLSYQEKQDKSGLVVQGTEGEDGVVVIPDNVEGKPVTGIGEGAFKDRDDLDTVQIPSTVTDIADDAFDGCDEVTIECTTGSAAEKYAKEHNMNYELIDKTIKSISVKTNPDKVIYTKEDSKLDLTGGRLTLTYTDDTTSPISMKKTGVQVSELNKAIVGEQEIQVVYKEKTTNFKVKIQDESIILGDINKDGKVDSTDLLLIKRHIIAGSKTDWILTGDKFNAANMNQDKNINATDLLLLKRKIVNM